ncbi:hypothetical protein IJU97_01130 [bacterium]|nr:hypothetical protein [bacterium]
MNNERNSKIAMNDHYNLLMRVDPLATPNMTSRPYNAFTYREMVDAIG